MLADEIALYDQPLLVTDGIAEATGRRLPEIWRDLLRDTMPSAPLVSEEDLPPSDARWLFKLRDPVDRARGLPELREPSIWRRRFEEYERLVGVLKSAELSGETSWRLHPELQRFDSAAEGRRRLEKEWIDLGYYSEVKSALKKLHRMQEESGWPAWLSANTKFDRNLLSQDPVSPILRTTLFPAPGMWYSMSHWLVLRSTERGVDGSVISTWRCAVVRIRILRPWMDLNFLFDPATKLEPQGGKPMLISDGTDPKDGVFPVGSMAVIPEELILSKNIRSDSPNPASQSPLAQWLVPEDLQFLAYVVHVLPETRK